MRLQASLREFKTNCFHFVSHPVRPSIANFTFTNDLREGQRASIICTVTSGDYPMKLQWLINGKPVSRQAGITIQDLSNYSSILLFESVSLEHKGNYTCIASNDAGTSSHSALMTIHGKHSSPNQRCIQQRTLERQAHSIDSHVNSRNYYDE